MEWEPVDSHAREISRKNSRHVDNWDNATADDDDDVDDAADADADDDDDIDEDTEAVKEGEDNDDFFHDKQQEARKYPRHLFFNIPSRRENQT